MKEYLFGVFPCLAALRSNRRVVHKLMVKDSVAKFSNPKKPSNLNDIISLAKERQIKIDIKSKDYLDRLVGNRPHQNVVIKASSLSYENADSIKFQSDDKLTHQSPQLWLALDQIQDPMNFGAILRSAGYFGIDGIFASKKNSCRLSPVVSKASAGTMEWLKIFATEDLPLYLQQLAKSGWDVIGSTMPGKDANPNMPESGCSEFSLKKKSVLVLGNEGFGIRDEVLNTCTELITIPSFSNSTLQDLDSLNVSVANGILLYSLVNKRRALLRTYEHDVNTEITQKITPSAASVDG